MKISYEYSLGMTDTICWWKAVIDNSMFLGSARVREIIWAGFGGSSSARRIRMVQWLRLTWPGTWWSRLRSTPWTCPTSCWCRSDNRPRGYPPPTRTCGWSWYLAAVSASWQSQSTICSRSYCRARTATNSRWPICNYVRYL